MAKQKQQLPMKRCIGCKEILPLNQFYTVVANEDRLHKYCIPCCKVSRALESVRKRDRTSKVSFRQYYRAKQLGLASDITITLVEVYRLHRGICALCNIWVKPRYASLEHKQPLSKGGTHIWDNIQLSHLKCNLQKSNKT